ncbi:hypothetical protein BDY21DRAFT_387067 [Lineolata rhizophorae]|uniref:DUF7924 domain-containing protein n=1 Tax=Lineolata rhizophorae TaxID=578093 RepID=A0A6A6NVJ8_9PEZI|nr:hypothetical protein BDY21DRAFT_387067 [Lineolata rhizophorae]
MWQRPSSTAEDAYNETASDNADSNNPVDYWRKHLCWPRTYFESDENMDRPFARKKSTSNIRRKSSATSISSSGTTPSDSTSREGKGSIYRDKRFDGLLAGHKSFLKKVLCKELLEAEQPVPQDSLFNDELFEETCDYLVNKSEAMVTREIGLLIHLKILAEKPRPQPDYSVGSDSSSFSEEQHKKLKPFNAYSTTLAGRAIVDLFRLVKREKEINREMLAFSVSHDSRSVRIYGHYPVIKGRDTAYYRHPIHTFDITELDSKDKWTAYKFTKNIYDTLAPNHFRRLCSAIDELPHEHNWDIPPLSEGTGLSQVFDTSVLQEDDNQASLPESQDVTSNTSFSQPRQFRKPREGVLESSSLNKARCFAED